MKTIMSVALMAVILPGCSSDTEGENIQKETQNKPIVFLTSDVKAVTDTRGTQVTKNSISSFGVTTSIYPATQTYATAKCGSYWYNLEVDAATGNTGRYWPGSDYKVSFFAHAPYEATGLTIGSEDEIGYPSYTYSVPSAIANQIDFVTADVIDHSGTGITQPVPLTFNHQCTDIRFKVYNQSTNAITVKSIAIAGVKYSGTYKGGTWTLNSGVNSITVNPFLLTLNTVVASKTTVDVTDATNHFIMLPQTVNTATDIFIVKTTEKGEEKTYTHTLEEDMILQKAKSYTFTLTLGDNKLIVDPDTEIMDWEPITQTIDDDNSADVTIKTWE